MKTNCHSRKRITEAQTKLLWDKQNGICAMYNNGCTTNDGRITLDNLERDHIIPLENGGSNELSNIWLLCSNCHRSKTRTQMMKKDHDVVMATNSKRRGNVRNLAKFNFSMGEPMEVD